MIASRFRRRVASKPSGDRFDEKQLRHIAQTAAGVLEAHPDPATVAIPFLHVQSAHPNAIRRYETLLSDGYDWRNRAHVALTRIGIPILSMLGNQAPWSGDALPEQVDVLFLSHFLRASDAAGGPDIYFGDLPERLGSVGVSAATALINHSRQPWRKLSAQWRTGSHPRVLLNRTVGLATELGFARQLNRAAKRLTHQAASNPLQGAIHTAAAGTAAGSASRTALRLAMEIKELVRRLKPKVLVTTFEGHSWERLVYAAAREAAPRLLCVGYSHAVLFPFQHAMTLRLGHGYDPDVILTAGDVTRDRLRREPSLAQTPIETLGSVRRSKTTLSTIAMREPICLIVPEGLVSECVLLIRVAAEAAALAPDIRFRIRLHPVNKREEVIAADRSFASLPSNIEWSTAALDSDLQAARWTIYRGSSTVIQAVQQGVRPFYFAPPGDVFDVDPLAALTAWRERFATGADLATTLTHDLRTAPTEQDKADARLAQDFCDRYFMPMQPEVLTALIEQRGVL